MAHESKLSHESKSFRSEVGLRIVSEDPQIRSMLPIDARKVAVLECNPMDPRFDQMHYVLKPSNSPLRPGERLSPGTTIEHERKIYSLREEITGLNLPVLNLYKFEKEGIWYKAGGVRFFVTNTLSSDKKGPTLVVFKDLPPATMMVEDRHALYVTPIIQYYASRQVPLLPSFENDIVVLKERGSTFAPCSQRAKCEQVRAACVLSIRDLLGLPASLWNRVDPAALYDPALGQFLDAPRVESAVRDITGVLGQPPGRRARRPRRRVTATLSALRCPRSPARRRSRFPARRRSSSRSARRSSARLPARPAASATACTTALTASASTAGWTRSSNSWRFRKGAAARLLPTNSPTTSSTTCSTSSPTTSLTTSRRSRRLHPPTAALPSAGRPRASRCRSIRWKPMTRVWRWPMHARLSVP